MNYLLLICLLAGSVSAFTASLPLPPSFSAPVETNAPSVKLEWLPVAYSTPVTYDVGSRTNTNGVFVAFANTALTNYTTALPLLPTFYSVRALGTNGASNYSAWAVPVLVAPPAPVTNVFTLMLLESPDGSTWVTNKVLNQFTNPGALLPGMKFWRLSQSRTNI